MTEVRFRMPGYPKPEGFMGVDTRRLWVSLGVKLWLEPCDDYNEIRSYLEPRSWSFWSGNVA